MTTQATGCHLLKGNRVLLKMANRGVSKGYWNFPGGRIEKNETPEDCAVREVLEETGLRVRNLMKHGVLRFAMHGERKPGYIVHVFSTRSFSGRMKSSDEGRLRWFDIHHMPFDIMWDDDRYWFPLVLDKRKFDASFRFDKDNRISDYSIRFFSGKP